MRSGHAAAAADGSPQHVGALAAQTSLAVDNVETVLHEAGMTLANVVGITVFTTDVDARPGAREGMTKGFHAAGGTLTSTLVGVTRLAFRELMVGIEASAVA